MTTPSGGGRGEPGAPGRVEEESVPEESVPEETVPEETVRDDSASEGAGGSAVGEAGGRVGLCAVRDTRLSLDEVLDAVNDRTAGGVVLFLGVVRDRDSGKDVDQLEYEAHPRASEALRAVLDEVAVDFDVVAVAATHRVGLLQIGDLATVVGASAVHRAQAFEAARAVIDRLKARVPIWKHQAFVDGTQEWVGALE